MGDTEHGPRPRDDAALAQIDRALIGLRHLWTGPVTLEDPTMGRVDMSTVWIVDALSQPETPSAGVSIRDLATALDVAHSTASRLVDRAEKSHALTRSASTRDARQVTVALTDTGRALARTALQFRTAHLDRLTADWSAPDRVQFAELLARFATALAATPNPTPLEHHRQRDR